MRGCSCRGTAGFAHVSCLAEQAKILCDEAEENNLGSKAKNASWARWYACSLCEQHYHGVVRCALGWACWKTYLSRPEVDRCRSLAMTQLGNGLSSADHHEDAFFVQEAELAMMRRLGASEYDMLLVQTCLANSHARLGRNEQAANMLRDVYSGHVRLNGEEHGMTLVAANNYAVSLANVERFEEAKSLLRKTIPVARRVLGESSDLTLKMRSTYAVALCRDTAATLDDLRQAVTTLEDTLRTARRVLGGPHPLVANIERALRYSREALSARETPPPPGDLSK